MRRILVADDSGVIRNLAARYLEVFDIELRFASSGTEAWSSFLEEAPDLVLSDIEMPGLNGVELARKIRDHAGNRTAVILMSSAQGGDGRAAVDRGDADAFVQKPLAAGALIDAVARLLGVVPDEVTARIARKPVRVVIADDTEVGRRMLGRWLGGDARFEVVGVARNGAEAVEATIREKPKLVLMDALMPVMDGISATREIMREAPTRVVIVTADCGPRGATAALDATKAGALELMAKPTWQDLEEGNAAASLDRLRELAEIPVVRRWHRANTPARPRPPPTAGRVQLVAVCASTGGPAVLAQLLPQIAAAVPHVTVLLVQHVLAGFSSALASWLTETSGVSVEVAVDGASPNRGRVLLAPDGHHMAVQSRDRIAILDDPPIGAHRPSGTLLFETAARAFSHEVLAVVLTGMGRDGIEGLHLVRSCGGAVLVQAPETCAVPGMPSAAIHEGLADLVLSPEQIAAEIVDRTRPEAMESQ